MRGNTSDSKDVERDLRDEFPWYPAIPSRGVELNQHFFNIWSSKDEKDLNIFSMGEGRLRHKETRKEFVQSKKAWDHDPIIYTTPTGKQYAQLLNKITIWRDTLEFVEDRLLGIDFHYDAEVEGKTVHTLGHHGNHPQPTWWGWRSRYQREPNAKAIEFRIDRAGRERIVEVKQRNPAFVPMRNIALIVSVLPGCSPASLGLTR